VDLNKNSIPETLRDNGKKARKEATNILHKISDKHVKEENGNKSAVEIHLKKV